MLVLEISGPIWMENHFAPLGHGSWLFTREPESIKYAASSESHSLADCRSPHLHGPLIYRGPEINFSSVDWCLDRGEHEHDPFPSARWLGMFCLERWRRDRAAPELATYW